MGRDIKGPYRTTYNVIDSIKGGCGKTTFAIILTEYLERSLKGKDEHCCFLDMDFLGTGLLSLVYGDDRKERLKENQIFITDKIRDFQTEAGRYIFPVTIGEKELYISFGNPSYRSKGEFQGRSRYNYVRALQYGLFRTGIKNALKKENLERQIAGKVCCVNLDMSPSIDSYSESVKEVLFDKRESNFLHTEDRTNYFLMISTDISHLYASRDYLLDFIKSEDKPANKIFIVFNDLMQVVKNKCEFISTEAEQYDSRKGILEDELSRLPEKDKKNIYFLAMNPYVNFQWAANNMTPLSVAGKEIYNTDPGIKDNATRKSITKGISDIMSLMDGSNNSDVSSESGKLGTSEELSIPFRFCGRFGEKMEWVNNKKVGEIIEWITGKKY